MILDQLDQLTRYISLHPRFAEAFRYLQETDFSALAVGRYPILGEEIFAIVNQYETKPAHLCPLEAHRKYIDLQYMVAGKEWIGYAPWAGQAESLSHRPEEDCFFYDGESPPVQLATGMFAIFFPSDLHAPNCGEGGTVKKVVVKILA